MTTVIFNDSPVVMTTLDPAYCPMGDNSTLRDGKLTLARWRVLCCDLGQCETSRQRESALYSFYQLYGVDPNVIVALVRTYAPGL